MAIIFDDTFAGSGLLSEHVSDTGQHWSRRPNSNLTNGIVNNGLTISPEALSGQSLNYLTESFYVGAVDQVFCRIEFDLNFDASAGGSFIDLILVNHDNPMNTNPTTWGGGVILFREIWWDESSPMYLNMKPKNGGAYIRRPEFTSGRFVLEYRLTQGSTSYAAWLNGSAFSLEADVVSAFSVGSVRLWLSTSGKDIASRIVRITVSDERLDPPEPPAPPGSFWTRLVFATETP